MAVKQLDLIDERYRLVRKLGSGGMATVWLAEDERLLRPVAIKRLHTAAPEDAAQRLVREAKLGAALNHPHIVTVYDAIPDSESVLIVMEYVAGRDLGRQLDRGRLDEDHAIPVLEAVAAALDHAHENGIVHRDVKPSNVLVGRKGEVKLTDLGIARALEDAAITQSGVILGSAPYMSPEQLEGAEVGPASDVYSLGLIAYELLSGERARAESGVSQAAYAVAHEPVPDIRDVRPETPARAAEVLSRALDRRPDRRPGSAGAFVRDLAAALRNGPDTAEMPAVVPLLGGEPTRPFPAPVAQTTEDDRRPWVAAGAIAALVAVVVAVAIIAGSGGGDDGATPAGDRAAQSERTGDQGGAKEDNGAGDQATAEPAPAEAAPSPTPPAEETATDAGDPGATVTGFYERAAADDYKGAWELTTPRLQSQLGGYDAFAEQQSTLESIEFPSVEVVSDDGSTASVAFQTVARHTDHTDRCQAQATLVNEGGSWLLDYLDSVTCS